MEGVRRGGPDFDNKFHQGREKGEGGRRGTVLPPRFLAGVRSLQFPPPPGLYRIDARRSDRHPRGAWAAGNRQGKVRGLPPCRPVRSRTCPQAPADLQRLETALSEGIYREFGGAGLCEIARPSR